ncbi:hypothetical protein ACFQZE_19205 [Paenibacillus sp. GCM10027627]|uniref:hypothetical protein n=1 Tax=unclassified Paenibacillus TaxID=185978 RepID=UPI00363B84AD
MFSRTRLLSSLVLALAFMLVSACGGEKKVMSTGTVTNGIYTNDFFGVSFQFPHEWIVHDSETVNSQMEDPNKLKIEKTDGENTDLVYLMGATKYPDGINQLGSSILVGGHKVGSGEKLDKDSFEFLKEELSNSDLPYKFNGISEVKVGGKDFFVMLNSVSNGDVALNQEVYVTIIDEHAFYLIGTYSDAGSRKEVHDIIYSVTFK